MAAEAVALNQVAEEAELTTEANAAEEETHGMWWLLTVVGVVASASALVFVALGVTRGSCVAGVLAGIHSSAGHATPVLAVSNPLFSQRGREAENLIPHLGQRICIHMLIS
eukprot:GHVU01118031.1.p4 GENE.GHVU01118031.1~~GHVU01118031.1.p4  ORF type:complete len:111 (-),score=16.79 GHVU01118031.1:71-403(-)